MIKIKINKSNETGIYERTTNGETYKFHFLGKTTRTTTFSKFIEEKKLYGRIKWYEDPIHNFSNGDIVEVKEIVGKTATCVGLDCRDVCWNGVEQKVFKKDIQFMKMVEHGKESQSIQEKI